MRKLLFLLFSLFCLQISAVPARRTSRIINLSDGSQKKVTMRGDELLHYYLDENGISYVGSDESGFVQASQDELQARWSVRLKNRNHKRLQRQSPLFNDAPTRNVMVGQKKGLVILVNFSDKKMHYDRSQFQDFFNLEGYSYQGMAGSVHDYFKDCSYGQFDLKFDVIGPVTVNKNLSYYGQNNRNGDDQHAAEMICEAVRLADAQGVNFKDYDWDGNGFVDQIFVIYAGYGEASGAQSYTIWPHEYDLSSARSELGDGEGAIKLDGVYIDTYACSNELYGTAGTNIDGIGTACHEFSHCLGLPDFYDTTGSSFGMDVWDVMDYGCYGDDGLCPCGYTSYERWFCGWLDPVELSDGCEVYDMPSLDSGPIAYIMYNDKNRNEYYLLENRQPDGWFRSDYGHGLLIIHVDYDHTAWINNTVNNLSSHQRMTIIPADNKLSNDNTGLAGDTWPGTKKKTSLTNSTIPAARLFTENSSGTKFMNKPIENISENNATKTVSFTFNGGTPLTTPTNLSVSNISSNSFIVNWDAVAGATEYELEIIERNFVDEEYCPSLPPLLYENFVGFNIGGINDSNKDISTELNEFTKVPSWSGEKIYCTPRNEIKVGSAKESGRIITPKVVPTLGHSIVSISARAYGNDASSIKVYITGRGETEYELRKDVTDTYSIIVEGNDPFSVSISASQPSNCRFYLSEIFINDGDIKDSFYTTFYHKTSDTSYSFTDLDYNREYVICLRAISVDKCSPWSDKMTVLLKTPAEEDYIECPNNYLKTNNMIYNLQGHQVRQIQKGINLIVSPDGTYKKVAK